MSHKKLMLVLVLTILGGALAGATSIKKLVCYACIVYCETYPTAFRCN
jgi:hypothetical protein